MSRFSIGKNRDLLIRLTFAQIVIFAATLGIGIYMTRAYETLVYRFQDEQTQRIADVAIADILWRGHYDAVGRVAGEVAGEVREAFAAGDRAALDGLLVDVYRRGAISGGDIALRGVSLLDLDHALVAVNWQQGAAPEIPGALVDRLAAREGGDRLRLMLHVWRDGDQPLMTVVAPIGGLRLAGYALLHVDPVPALTAIDLRLGMAAGIAGLDSGRLLLDPNNYTIPEGAQTADARLLIRGPDDTPLAHLDVRLDVTELRGALNQTRLLSFGIFILIVGGLAIASMLGVWLYLARLHRRELDVQSELEQARQAETERLRRDQEEQKQRTEAHREMMNALADEFAATVHQAVAAVSRSAQSMRTNAESLSTIAEETNRQSMSVASAAEQAASNVETVAAATEELSASIGEIARQVSESSRISTEAVEEARRTNETIAQLSASAERIGEVVKLIQAIAEQTNLLALNATIEAARAGDAGKGFAVVASEVKNLATQTSKATEDIAGQIDDIQSATGGAVGAIQGIGSTIERINGIVAAIAAAVEEQGAATSEISRNITDATAGTANVANTIGEVTRAAGETGEMAGRVLDEAADLNQQAADLGGHVDSFLEKVRRS